MDQAKGLSRRNSRGLRRPGQRTMLLFAVAAVAAIAGLLLTLILNSALGSDAVVGSEAIEGLPAPPLGQPVVSATIHVDPGVTDVVTGYGWVWASTPNAVFKIDPQSNEVLSTITVEGIGDTGKMAIGEGSVWVTHGVDKVSRIDPDSGKLVATIDVGLGVRGIAVGGGSVWVTREPQPDEIEGFLVRIDPLTETVVGDPLQIGVAPGPVAFASGAVWVTLTSEEGTLVMVDPETMTTVAEISGVRGSVGLVAGQVWAATGESIVQIDPSTGSVVGDVAIPLSWQVGFGSDVAWVLTLTGSLDPDIYLPDPARPATVIEVDPSTGEQLGESVPVGDSPSFMTVGEDSVWVAQYDTGVIQRIDLVS
jgi:streptogramin lyase